jgi:glycosyltransferase involved in cell wall biosynthesis
VSGPGRGRDVRRIDQIVPTLASRDAIGQHTLALRELVRSMGIASDIYYANASVDVLGEGRHVDALDDADSEGRWLLYHLSIGSPAGEAFARRPEPKLVDYHNITPVELLRLWEPAVAEELRWGRSQMGALAPITRFAMADSAFNELELRRAGYEHTAVAPLLIDLDSFAGTPDPATMARLQAAGAGGGHDLLFVGKVAPHKAEHDLVKALVAYRRLYDPEARLHIVGGPIGDAYPRAVMRLAASFGVADAVELAGSVTHEELVAYYRCADAFVCLSDHEGFCVPLLEAMAHGLPIIAYGATAVPDTVGDAGLVLPDKRPATVAGAIDRVVGDEDLRLAMRAAAKARLDELSLDQSRRRVTDTLVAAVGLGPDGGG